MDDRWTYVIAAVVAVAIGAWLASAAIRWEETNERAAQPQRPTLEDARDALCEHPPYKWEEECK